LRYVTLFHGLRRGFYSFGPVFCLDLFLGRDVWLVCRLVGFWKYKIEDGMLVAYQQILRA
jgi:hypothetical protein